MSRGPIKCYPERSCEGKVAHASREAADQAARVLRRQGDVVRPYRCGHCGAWHIGHRRSRGVRGNKG